MTTTRSVESFGRHVHAPWMRGLQAWQTIEPRLEPRSGRSSRGISPGTKGMTRHRNRRPRTACSIGEPSRRHARPCCACAPTMKSATTRFIESKKSWTGSTWPIARSVVARLLDSTWCVGPRQRTLPHPHEERLELRERLGAQLRAPFALDSPGGCRRSARTQPGRAWSGGPRSGADRGPRRTGRCTRTPRDSVTAGSSPAC